MAHDTHNTVEVVTGVSTSNYFGKFLTNIISYSHWPLVRLKWRIISYGNPNVSHIAPLIYCCLTWRP